MNNYIDNLLDTVIDWLDKLLNHLRSIRMGRPRKVNPEVPVAEVAGTEPEAVALPVESSAGEPEPIVEAKEAAKPVLTHVALGIAEIPGKGHQLFSMKFNPLTLEVGEVKTESGIEHQSEINSQFRIKAVNLGVIK